ncbi:hypothetical protein LTR78_008298 [Recurvomyces mirabilis]|uniref:MIT domain-containing protein n=1 Tax=Recurvomyces mirabilis TaxID=574656 RepID=A0AAE0TUU3_9PEZI|nr:hypothetical protein LTR78_008298 [Recurvomyces mirabilis]KAK5158577.1 hypothetical protein LTS14_003597 [Recurvomyces mirabilis]
MATAPLAALHKQRYSSRSNSLSSSSVVTIKRTGSLSSSSTGARNSTAPMLPQTTGEPSLIALRVGREQISQQDPKRRQSLAVDPGSHAESEGMNNLNRWSQSTNSSAASGGQRRNRASSGAALQSIAGAQFSPRSNRTTIDHSPRASPNRRQLSSRQRQLSPDGSPEALRRRTSRPDLPKSLTALPPLHAIPALVDHSNDTASPSTISTVQTTPSTQSSYMQDYFVGDGISPRNKMKDKRPVMIRNHTAPLSAAAQLRAPAPTPAQQDEPLVRPRTNEDEGHDRYESRAERHERHERREQNDRPSDGSSRRRSRTREIREKEKKAMLSKALQKANTAVLLDNAQNFVGALEAYTDACRLLQQVMERSSGADDKRKLEDIRTTYSTRIEELEQLENSRPSSSDHEKELPERPMSDDSAVHAGNFYPGPVSPIAESIADSAVIGTTTTTRVVDVPRLSYPEQDGDNFFSRTMEAVQNTEGAYGRGSSDREQLHAHISPDEPASSSRVVQQTLFLPEAEQSKYMPAPLSPRKPSPQLKPEVEAAWPQDPEQQTSEEAPRDVAHDQPDANETAGSWLDTIDESGSSCASSVHSFSQDGPRRKHLRTKSGDTDPDFDAAFDDAVEAAYGEGLEPDLEAHGKRNTAYRHAAKESIIVPSSAIQEVLSPTNEFHPPNSLHQDLDDEEEERLLDEITNDYAHGFNFDLSTKSALPRQSDSSGYSRSTWQSSQASVDRTTAATSLSTVAEDALGGALMEEPEEVIEPVVPQAKGDFPPLQAPPPNTALPRPPSTSGSRLSSVRARRLSGQNNLKQLKIETSSKSEARKRASTFHHSPSPQPRDDEGEDPLNRDFKFGAVLSPSQSDLQHEHILTSPPSLDMRSAAVDSTIRPTTATVNEQRRSVDEMPGELPSARLNPFRKNKSSVSLRDQHSTLLSSPDESIPSLATPMSSTFMPLTGRRGDEHPFTSQRAKFSSFDAGAIGFQQAGGAYLFDTTLSNLQSPTSPRSPKSPSAGAPLGLEPCPESFLLRPFWLMRAMASTLTHPRGGFVTTRLFVPREVWQTRGVKLKSVEEKVANCDLLTAALGRLAGVDTYDADAVMVELQSFEEVMERVQAALSKKLGSDVGVHGVTGMFKDAATNNNMSNPSNSSNPGQATDTTSGSHDKNAKTKEGKSYLTSWGRKLRSKNSTTPLTSSNSNSNTHHQPGKNSGMDSKDQPIMPSVPMTTFVPVERRGQKRDARDLTFQGPQKEYMESLARLFEGVQVLDQIARQVEDPGLKHSSPTHVGLELSIRHAAEFFAFYVCRFVLADMGTLLDKFVKRGTEWVLA